MAEAPPRVGRRVASSEAAHVRAARRTLVIRHASGHRVVALLEILSPANKDRPRSVTDVVDKALSALRQGIHLLVVDLFPPGPHELKGIHALIWENYGDELDAPPRDQPVTLASYLWAYRGHPRLLGVVAALQPTGRALWRFRIQPQSVPCAATRRSVLVRPYVLLVRWPQRSEP